MNKIQLVLWMIWNNQRIFLEKNVPIGLAVIGVHLNSN